MSSKSRWSAAITAVAVSQSPVPFQPVCLAGSGTAPREWRLDGTRSLDPPQTRGYNLILPNK